MKEHHLSRRQQQIADLMRKGLRPAQMAAVLGISVQTVKNYMTCVYRHFGIDGPGKRRIFMELAGGMQLQPHERRRIINLVEAKQLQCATREEIDAWSGGKPSTNQLVWRFCIEACHEWCIAQRAAGTCIRDELEYQRIAQQRETVEERIA